MSGHRTLAPSNKQSLSSGKASDETPDRTHEATPGTSNPSRGGSSTVDSNLGAESHKRRRVPGNVSQMACSECRQARQKCDGERPNLCSRCSKRKLTCIYEPHIKTHKDDLIREIEELRMDKSNLEERNREVTEAQESLVSRNRELQETTERSTIILETIRQDGHDKEIIARMRAGETIQSIADWLMAQDHVQKVVTLSNPARQGLLNVVRGFEKDYRTEDHMRRVERGQNNEPEIVWTQISHSNTLIKHLFTLYFTWVHPAHMLFSQDDFMHAFRSNEGRYCTPALVNAICAMGCHLLEYDGSNKVEPQQAATLREGFLAEARRSLTPDTYLDMTSIQSLAIMYLVEVSSGKARSAMGYLRCAVENIRTAKEDQSAESCEITRWGINTLNTACVGMTYQKLYAPELPREVTFESVGIDQDSSRWRYYRSTGDENGMPERRSYSLLTVFWQTKLFHIINNSLNMYCGYNGRCTAEKVIRTYKAFTTWRENLPQILQSLDVESQPLPHVLNLQWVLLAGQASNEPLTDSSIQYHTAVMEHLTPLIYCNRFSDVDAEELRRMVIFHARRGLDVVKHSRHLYKTRYQLPLLSFCTLQLADMLVRESPEDPVASDVVSFCLESLAETKAGFAICGPLASLFRRTAEQHGIPIAPDIEAKLGGPVQYTVDHILDACTRLAYTMPLDQTFRHIDRAIAMEWPAEWERQVVATKPGEGRRSAHKPSPSEQYMSIGSLLND